MPELPEVEGLVTFLRERSVGRTIAGVDVGAIWALKTFAPAPQDLVGLPVVDVVRRGKWIDLATDGSHLLVHLAKAGWLRWYDAVPTTPLKPRSPIALRVRLGDGAGFDLTEAGTHKRLAVHVVERPDAVPAVASLGPEPLGLGLDEFAALLRRRNQQVKGALRDQGLIAGIGNAYSDEILHAARLSPFALTGRLTDEEVTRLHAAMGEVLTGAVAAASGRPAAALKDAKRAGMRVHGRTGEPCPVCGETVREVSFADSALQYCARCQTGGKVLADRRMSRLLR
ncbi:MAG: Fpg/Nei family DNA glycosylase [Actinomycetota bacterium]